jgi:hypothetical protein
VIDFVQGDLFYMATPPTYAAPTVYGPGINVLYSPESYGIDAGMTICATIVQNGATYGADGAVDLRIHGDGDAPGSARFVVGVLYNATGGAGNPNTWKALA